jgi:hypothetical protein
MHVQTHDVRHGYLGRVETWRKSKFASFSHLNFVLESI